MLPHVNCYLLDGLPRAAQCEDTNPHDDTHRCSFKALRERNRIAAFGATIKILDEFVAVTGHHRKRGSTLGNAIVVNHSFRYGHGAWPRRSGVTCRRRAQKVWGQLRLRSACLPISGAMLLAALMIWVVVKGQ